MGVGDAEEVFNMNLEHHPLDLTYLLIAALIILLFTIIFLGFRYAARETTFEEAVAEQLRKSDKDLLIPQRKIEKPKEKKKKEKKKVVKPVQTKVQTKPTKEPFSKTSTSKTHVEFDIETTIVSDGTTPPVEKEHKTKENSPPLLTKPILVNLEEKSPVSIQLDNIEEANHFEEIIPFDELELKLERSGSSSRRSSQAFKEEILPEPVKKNVKETESNVKSKVSRNEKKKTTDTSQKTKPDPAITKSVEVERNVVEPPVKEQTEVIEETVLHQFEAVVELTRDTDVFKKSDKPQMKQQKKKKFEEDAEKCTELSGLELLSMVRKSNLTNSESQTLIEVLLNKQHASETSGESQWIERSRPDTVTNLKKQLDEKDLVIQEHKETLKGLQTKLVGIRAETKKENGIINAAKKEIADNLAKKTDELKNTKSKLQQLTEEQDAKHSEVKKLKSKYEEQLRLHQTVEEENAQNKEEISTLNEKIKKADELRSQREKDLEISTAAKQAVDSQLTSLQQTNHQLVQQVQRLELLMQASDMKKEDDRAISDEVSLLRNRINDAEDAKTLLSIEIQKQKEAKVNVENERENLRQQVSSLESNSEELSKLLETATRAQLEKEVHVTDMVQQIEGATNELTFYKLECSKLTEQITNMVENPESPPSIETINGEVGKTADAETLEKLKSLELMKKSKEEEVAILIKELDSVKDELVQVYESLESQRQKNNELREKNWRVAEALSSTENLVQDAISKKLLYRTAVHELFPKALTSIESPEDDKQLIEYIKKEIKEYNWTIESTVKESESREEASYHNHAREKERLETHICHLQSVLTDTENDLRSLALDVDRHEREMKAKVDAKDEEINEIMLHKESLERKVHIFECDIRKLTSEKDSKAREVELLEERLQDLEANDGSWAQVGNSSSEKESLSKKLTESQDLIVQLKEENGKVVKSLELVDESMKLIVTERDQIAEDLEHARCQIAQLQMELETLEVSKKNEDVTILITLEQKIEVLQVKVEELEVRLEESRKHKENTVPIQERDALQDKLKELQSKLETEESEKNEWVVKHWTSQQDCVKLKQELDKVHELAKEQHFSIEDLGNKNVQLEIDLKTEVDKTKSTPQLLNQEETCLDLKAQGVSSNGPSGDNIPPNHTSLSKNGDSTDFLPGKEHDASSPMKQ